MATSTRSRQATARRETPPHEPEPLPQADAELLRRHHAAISLIQRGTIEDPVLMLSYVIWPSDWLEDVESRNSHS